MIDKKYTAYAESVINGEEVACLYVKQACKRYLDFFNKYDFRQDKVERVVNFIYKLKHFTGKFKGQNFTLLPYQLWIVASIFGFYHKGTDKRVCNYVYIELARKSGKTALMAAICLYLMIADNEAAAEIELVANSAKQAKIAYNMCSIFLGGLDPKKKYFQRWRDNIQFPKTNSFIQVLSSDASGNDGFNSYAFLLDECHEQPDSKLYDVMCSSQGMRENPLAMIITTAGFNLYGFCYKYRSTCLEVLSGIKEDDTLFSAIYTLDEGDSWDDPKVWKKANPSLGSTVTEEYLSKQVTRAKNDSSLEVGVRTKNFNQWVNSSNTWLGNDLLLKYSKSVNLEDFKDSTCHIGIDLAAVSDLTAVSIMVKRENIHYFKTFYYLPQSALANNVNSELYKEWKRKGYLTITPGNVTDYDYVLNDILKVSKILPIEKIAYDSYNATQFAINATEQNLPLEPFSQALWNFNRPTKEFERLLKQGNVVIDNNEITRWCFNNVVLKYDHNDNCKPVKEQDMNKIDGVIAIVEALGVSLKPEYDNSISY